MPTTIAVASPTDVIEVWRVLYIGWLCAYPSKEHGITTADIHHRFLDLEAGMLTRCNELILKPPVGTITVVMKGDDQRVQGFCQASKRAGVNVLNSLYVLPQHHNQGIGSALWEFVLEHWFDRHQPTTVRVATYNHPAITFYRRRGFRPTDTYILDPFFQMRNGQIIPGTEMWRPACQG